MSNPAELCSILREDVAEVWDKIYSHPFLQEVEAGSLPDIKYKFYFTQNAQYIETAVRFLAIAAAKAPDAASRDFCLELAVTSNEKCREQMEWVDELPGEVPAEMAPANFAYTRHLMELAHQGGTVDVLTGLLPCPWTYDEFAHAIHHKLTQPVAARWLEWWASDEHEEIVDNMKTAIDRLSADLSKTKRDALSHAFLTSSRLEYMFWDMAYYEQSWPV